MATDARGRDRRLRYVLCGLLGCVVLIVGIGLYFARSRPPQLGVSEDVYRTVDALFTAVQSRDAGRVTECEARLSGYGKTGELPPAPARVLDGVIRKTRSGSWESAAEQLYDFMLGQRREGASEPRSKPANSKAKKR